jgi:hypothetical protein
MYTSPIQVFMHIQSILLVMVRLGRVHSLMKKRRTICLPVRHQVKRASNVASGRNGDVVSVTTAYRSEIEALSEKCRMDMNLVSEKYFEKTFAEKYRLEKEEIASKIKILLAIPKTRLYLRPEDISFLETDDAEGDLPPKQEITLPAFYVKEYEQSLKMLETILNLWKEQDFIHSKKNSGDIESHFRSDDFIYLTLQLHHRIMIECIDNLPLQSQVLRNAEIYRANIDWERLWSFWKQVKRPQPGLHPSSRSLMSCQRNSGNALYLYEIFHWCQLVSDEAMYSWIRILASQLPFKYDGKIPTAWFKPFISAVMKLRMNESYIVGVKMDSQQFQQFSSVIQAWSISFRPDIMPDLSFLSFGRCAIDAIAHGGVVSSCWNVIKNAIVRIRSKSCSMLWNNVIKCPVLPY